MAQHNDFFEHLGNPVVNFIPTLQATGKKPIIANRIWKTLADATSYIEDYAGTAVSGLVLSVVNDPVVENNGLYEVQFKSFNDDNTPVTASETDNNLKLVKLGTDGSTITGGRLVKGTFKKKVAAGETISSNSIYYTIENKQWVENTAPSDIVVSESDNYYVLTKTFTPLTDDALIPITLYIEFTKSDGEKMYVDINELATGTDIHVSTGEYDTTSNSLILHRTDEQNIVINLSNLKVESASLELPSVENGKKLTVLKDGVINQDTIDKLTTYIDNYDCGTFSISLPEA